jgi:hypothetical protein
VRLGIGVMQGVHRPAKLQVCKPEKIVERLLLQVCAESKDFNIGLRLKSFHKECEQRVSF